MYSCDILKEFISGLAVDFWNLPQVLEAFQLRGEIIPPKLLRDFTLSEFCSHIKDARMSEFGPDLPAQPFSSRFQPRRTSSVTMQCMSAHAGAFDSSGRKRIHNTHCNDTLLLHPARRVVQVSKLHSYLMVNGN